MKKLLFTLLSICTFAALNAQTLPTEIVNQILGGKNKSGYFFKKIKITADSLIQTYYGANDKLWDAQYNATPILKRVENNGITTIISQAIGSEFFTLNAFGNITADKLKSFNPEREYQTMEAALAEPIALNDLNSMEYYTMEGMKKYNKLPTLKVFTKKEANEFMDFAEIKKAEYLSLPNITTLQKNSLEFGLLLGGAKLWADAKNLNGYNSMLVVTKQIMPLAAKDKQIAQRAQDIFGDIMKVKQPKKPTKKVK